MATGQINSTARASGTQVDSGIFERERAWRAWCEEEFPGKGWMLSVSSGLTLVGPICSAITLEELAAKVERLEAENRALEEKANKLESAKGAAQHMGPAVATAAQAPTAADGVGNGVRFNHQYSCRICRIN